VLEKWEHCDRLWRKKIRGGLSLSDLKGTKCRRTKAQFKAIKTGPGKKKGAERAILEEDFEKLAGGRATEIPYRGYQTRTNRDPVLIRDTCGK